MCCVASFRAGAPIAFHHDFSRLKTRAALIEALRIPDDLFEAVLDFTPPPPDLVRRGPEPGDADLDIPVFLRHDIPKRRKGRGHRTVWEPVLAAPVYKALARKLNTFLEVSLPGYPHDAAFGFRPGRNIRENAAVHAGHDHLLVVDIEDFFGSIDIARIAQLFRAAGMAPNIAQLLARFVTLDGALPAGLPTSPVISNAIALDVDRDLQALAERYDASYSRYADDISFSGDDKIPEVAEVETALASHGFGLALGKTRRSRRGQSHFVTGLSISDPQGPHVPRAVKHRLRQHIHYARRFGLVESLERRGVKGARQVRAAVNSLDGLVKFVAHHERNWAASLRADWRAIVAASAIKPSFSPKVQARAAFDIYIDETEFTWRKVPMLALGLSVSQHQAVVDAATRVTLETDQGDLFAAGRTALLKRKGLHYADASEDLRLAYVTRLAALPFEGYVAMIPMPPPADYETAYLRLLGALLPRRLMAAESRKVRIFWEANNKVDRKALEACVLRAWETLEARDDRRPAKIGLAVVDKKFVGVSVPDFLLGVLGRYLGSTPAPEGMPERRERLMFERLRDKYRVILDLRDWTEYSRRNPITP